MLISLPSPVCGRRCLRVSPKNASEYLLSRITQEHYLFLNHIPKLREYKFINTHPIVFTSLLYFHSLPQTHYPRPLFPYPACFLLPKKNGQRNAIETHGPHYLTGSDQLSSFCCAEFFHYLTRNGPKLETKSRAAHGFGGAWIHISFAVLHYMDFVYLNPIR